MIIRTDKKTGDATFFDFGMADETVSRYCKDFDFVTRAEAKANLYDLLMGANSGIEGAKVSWKLSSPPPKPGARVPD